MKVPDSASRSRPWFSSRWGGREVVRTAGLFSSFCRKGEFGHKRAHRSQRIESLWKVVMSFSSSDRRRVNRLRTGVHRLHALKCMTTFLRPERGGGTLPPGKVISSFGRNRKFGHKRAHRAQRPESRGKVVRDRSSSDRGWVKRAANRRPMPSRTQVRDYFPAPGSGLWNATTWEGDQFVLPETPFSWNPTAVLPGAAGWHGDHDLDAWRRRPPGWGTENVC